jgi:hypothetical protein
MQRTAAAGGGAIEPTVAVAASAADRPYVMPQEPTVLAYADRGHRRRSWGRRPVACLAIVLLLAAYTCSWQRFPYPRFDRGVARVVFRPAYELDRLLRPEYWQGTWPWATSRPAA